MATREESSAAKVVMSAGDPPELGAVILERRIPSDVALVHPLVVRTVQFLHQESLFVPREESRVALCLAEALVNAVAHGNRKDFTKEVQLQIFLGEEEWGFVVRDQGEGFQLNDMNDPLGSAGIWTECGRGVYLMTHYMDRVEYYNGGRTVVLARRL